MFARKQQIELWTKHRHAVPTEGRDATPSVHVVPSPAPAESVPTPTAPSWGWAPLGGEHAENGSD